jgi:zinc-binding in reverse transcriptase
MTFYISSIKPCDFNGHKKHMEHQSVQIFVWLMLHNKILTLNNLIRKGWQMSNICHMYRNQEERVNHLFHECHFATQLRSYMEGIL